MSTTKKKITHAPRKPTTPAEDESAPPPVFIRTKHEGRGALDRFIAKLNEERCAKGLRPTSLSMWARDTLYRQIGREDLTSTAEHRAEIELTSAKG